MNNLLTLKFWFSSHPPKLLPLFSNLLLAVTIAFIMATFVFSWLKKKKSAYQKIYFKLFDFTVTNSIIGLLLVFFNMESIRFFSSRFWLILWLLEIVVWLIFILKDFKKIPVYKKEKETQAEYKKYIPK